MAPGAHMTMGTGEIRAFSRCTLYDDVSSVMVDIDGDKIEVKINRETGPRVLSIGGRPGGPNDIAQIPVAPPSEFDKGCHNHKKWIDCTSTESKMLVLYAAKINKQRMGARPPASDPDKPSCVRGSLLRARAART
ncbi:unnamed protein product [Polarella glacialis]|uniref:Uncharacterized protein n=1 Tax=Polarella glacialis TaxID=89957 RepID=A0A813LH79_POLGL|nr:unnamed protein product [Polarella glacialis]